MMLQCTFLVYLLCISCPMDLQCPIKAVTINQSIKQSINSHTKADKRHASPKDRQMSYTVMDTQTERRVQDVHTQLRARKTCTKEAQRLCKSPTPSPPTSPCHHDPPTVCPCRHHSFPPMPSRSLFIPHTHTHSPPYPPCNHALYLYIRPPHPAPLSPSPPCHPVIMPSPLTPHATLSSLCPLRLSPCLPATSSCSCHHLPVPTCHVIMFMSSPPHGVSPPAGAPLPTKLAPSWAPPTSRSSLDWEGCVQRHRCIEVARGGGTETQRHRGVGGGTQRQAECEAVAGRKQAVACRKQAVAGSKQAVAARKQAVAA